MGEIVYEYKKPTMENKQDDAKREVWLNNLRETTPRILSRFAGQEKEEVGKLADMLDVAIRHFGRDGALHVLWEAYEKDKQTKSRVKTHYRLAA